MPKVSESFARKYVNAADIGNKVHRLKIERVLIEQVLHDRKWVIYFAGAKKGLGLNRTNAEALGRALGDDSDAWIGHEVDVFTERVEFQDREVDGVRVQAVAPPAPDSGDEEIPF